MYKPHEHHGQRIYTAEERARRKETDSINNLTGSERADYNRIHGPIVNASEEALPKYLRTKG